MAGRVLLTFDLLVLDLLIVFFLFESWLILFLDGLLPVLFWGLAGDTSCDPRVVPLSLLNVEEGLNAFICFLISLLEGVVAHLVVDDLLHLWTDHDLSRGADATDPSCLYHRVTKEGELWLDLADNTGQGRPNMDANLYLQVFTIFELYCVRQGLSSVCEVNNSDCVMAG